MIRPRHHTAERRATRDTQQITGAWQVEKHVQNVYNVGMAGGTNVQNELCGTRSGRAPKCGHAPAVHCSMQLAT